MFLCAATFTTAGAFTDGTHSYGFHSAAEAPLPALRSSRASWRIVDHGPGVEKAILIALDAADSQATIGTPLFAPDAGAAEALDDLTPVLSVTRFDAGGSVISGPVQPSKPWPDVGEGKGKVPGRRCVRREGTSEAAPAAVRQAVGGGCRSGWGRLLSVTNAIEAGISRQGDSGWA